MQLKYPHTEISRTKSRKLRYPSKAKGRTNKTLRFHCSGNCGFFPSSVVFMNNSLGNSLVNELYCFFLAIYTTFFSKRSFQSSFQIRFENLISQSFFCSNSNSFFCRFNIWHYDYLQCKVLRIICTKLSEVKHAYLD